METDASRDPPRALRVAADDDVAVALMSLEAGEQVELGASQLRLLDAIPAGHKFAVRRIAARSHVRRYGAPIGVATKSVEPGQHVHTHNLVTALDGEVIYQFAEAAKVRVPSPAAARHFRGYVRADGSVGTRNEVWILPMVGCVGRTAERVARAAASRFGARIDGVHAFNHPFGCSQMGADLDGTAAILAALAQNPNAGGVLLLSLGCESNQLDAMMDRIPAARHHVIRTVRSQASSDEFADALQGVAELAEIAAATPRTEVPLSALRLGVKCGGSDAMSGLTANPLIGRVADAVTQAGGSVLMTEVPEMFGAEHLLLARARDEAVFNRLAEVTNRFKRYFLDNNEPVSENPSPGNITGGITTLEEKSLGAIQKGGTAIVTDVLDYGARVARTGLTILEGPGNDAVSTTALAAAGATLTLFSTGRGTPLGSPVPTMKISSNHSLATRKPQWIDFDASVAVHGSMDTATAALLDRVVAVASGEPARNEANDERAIGIWKRGVTL